MIAVLGSIPYSQPPEHPRAGWSAEIFLGTGIDADTPLRIRQPGYPDITIKAAHWHEKSFQEAPLYTYRLSRWKQDKAWEAQMMHHKIILTNKHPDIEYFNVSHGYNFVTLNRAWLLRNGYDWRVGAGLVISHPESKIRGRKLDNTGGFVVIPGLFEGFYLSGGAAMIGAGRRFYLSERTYTRLEGQFYVGYAQVPIRGGFAEVPNVAWLVTWGIGFDLSRPP